MHSNNRQHFIQAQNDTYASPLVSLIYGHPFQQLHVSLL